VLLLRLRTFLDELALSCFVDRWSFCRRCCYEPVRTASASYCQACSFADLKDSSNVAASSVGSAVFAPETGLQSHLRRSFSFPAAGATTTSYTARYVTLRSLLWPLATSAAVTSAVTFPSRAVGTSTLVAGRRSSFCHSCRVASFAAVVLPVQCVL